MDEEWCPDIVRRFQQDSLRLGWVIALKYMQMGGGELPDMLSDAYLKSNSTQFLELASGGGGPSPILAEMVEDRLRVQNSSAKVLVQMSDLFPNIASWDKLTRNNSRLSFISESVNALKVPLQYSRGSFRLICGAFHHFPPDQAKELMADAVRNKKGIAVLDGASSPFLMFFLPFGGFFIELLQLLLEFSIEKLFFFPVFAATMAHDGFTSSLRMYAKHEMESMSRYADPQGQFDWVVRGYPTWFPILQVTIGSPKLE